MRQAHDELLRNLRERERIILEIRGALVTLEKRVEPHDASRQLITRVAAFLGGCIRKGIEIDAERVGLLKSAECSAGNGGICQRNSLKEWRRLKLKLLL